MFDTDGETNYDKVFLELLAEFHAKQNYPDRVALFGQICTVTTDGIMKEGKRLDTTGSILVLRYLMTGGNAPLTGCWTPYRDLKDGARFSSFIRTNIEDKLAHDFAGRLSLLKDRLAALGGIHFTEGISGDLVMVVHPFPGLPVLCLFYDKDDEFDARFQFLFDGSAPSYLDMEALAVVLQYIYQNAA